MTLLGLYVLVFSSKHSQLLVASHCDNYVAVAAGYHHLAAAMDFPYTARPTVLDYALTEPSILGKISRYQCFLKTTSTYLGS